MPDEQVSMELSGDLLFWEGLYLAALAGAFSQCEAGIHVSMVLASNFGRRSTSRQDQANKQHIHGVGSCIGFARKHNEISPETR